jgi:hypothetical protein
MPKVFKRTGNGAEDEKERRELDVRELLYIIARSLTAFDQLGKTEAQARLRDFEDQRMKELKSKPEEDYNSR